MKLADAKNRIVELEAEVARLSKYETDGRASVLADLVNDCDLPASCNEYGFIVDHVSSMMVDCATVGEFLELLGASGRPRHRDDVLDAIVELTWRGVDRHWRGAR